MFHVLDHDPLTAPVLLVAFDGWVSAGGAGTETARHVTSGGVTVARFDPDLLFDYRVNRPGLSFADGIIQEISWPSVEVQRRHIGDRDILSLTGPEPNWHWQAFGDSVADLAVDLGVIQQVSLGGIPWAAPHTRPTIVVTTSSRPDLLGEDANLPEGTLRVPASAASIVERAIADRGIPTVGFWARVPHYVNGVYHPAILTLVERLSRHLGVAIPLETLVEQAADQRRQLDQALEDQPQIAQVIDQLEDLYDASGEMASGEEIAAEIERFLQDRSSDDPA